jgi:U3 small nucleolar RNA-associated protein 10
VVLHAIDAQVGAIKNADPAATIAVLEFVPKITSLIQNSKDLSLVYSAIGCIDQITEHFGKKDKSAVIEAVSIIAGENALRSSEDQLRIVSMLCLATMVDVLQADFISFLPQILPLVFDYLKSSIADEHTLLRIEMANAGFAVINAVAEAEHLHYMFTGEYLDRGLEVARLAAQAKICSGTRKQFYRLIVGRKDEPAEIFSAFNRNYGEELQRAGYEVSYIGH